MENEDGGGERAEGMRRQAADVAGGVEDRLDELRGYVDEASSVVRDYAREHPWAAIGIAAGIGFVIGRLLSRA